MEKPYSEACARNRGPLLEVLKVAFATCNHVLEVGSGSGQHAVHFAAGLPHIQWQTSELAPLHAGIHAWLADAQLPVQLQRRLYVGEQRAIRPMA